MKHFRRQCFDSLFIPSGDVELLEARTPDRSPTLCQVKLPGNSNTEKCAILKTTKTKIHLCRYTKAKIHVLNLSPALCQFKSPEDYTSTIYKIDTQPYMEKVKK